MRKLIAILFFSFAARAAAPSLVGVINTPAEVKGTGTSDTITLTAGVAAGHRVGIVVVNEANYSVNAKNVASIADNKGHTGTQRGIVHTSSVHNGEYWDYVVTTPLVAGDTITVTLQAPSPAQDTARGYICFDIAGTATSGQPDVTVIQTTSSFGTTVNTSITTATDNDFVAGLVVFQGDKSYTLGNGTGISSQLLVGFVPASTVGLKIQAFCNVKSPAGAFSPAGTFNVNESAIVIMVAYKPVTTRARYVDLTAGSDAAAGTSTGTAWRHIPGDTNATGNASSHVPAAGDTFFVKGGSSGSFDVAIKQAGAAGNPITYDGTGVDEFGAAWGSGRAINDLNNTYYHAFYSNPGKSFITIKGFKISHAKNNNNSANVMINRAGSDQVVTYAGDGDIYNEGGIFDYGGTDWYVDNVDESEFENCYDRSVLNAENDSDVPFVTPQEIPTTKAGMFFYQGANNVTVTNCNIWAIGRTAIKFFGATNFLVTDCDIGGTTAAGATTNKGWFAVGVKMSNGGSFGAGPGVVRRTLVHDGWQYQGDEAQQRCHAGDWFHLFGDNDVGGLLTPDGDVHDILFDRVKCYSDHTFAFNNGTSHYFLELGCYNITWLNCLDLNDFSGAIEMRDTSNVVIYAHTFISAANQPLLVKAGTANGFAPKAIKMRNSVLVTYASNSANVPMGTSSGTYSGPMIDSDYNLYYHPNHANMAFWNGNNYTFAGWKTFSGQDAHSIEAAPKLISIPSGSGWANTSSGDYRPDSSQSSPLIGAGVDLSSTFTIFYDGTTRTVPWTIGALPALAGGGGGGGSPGAVLRGRLPTLKTLRRR